LPKLKAAQHWIHREILEKLLVHGSAHGFLPGRNIASNAGRHMNSRIVLKMDIKNFFPTITLPRVRGVFRHAGYRKQISTLLALLSTESPREIVQHNGTKYFIATGPRCLPQGAPTSPALTNTICLRMDRRLSGLAKKLGWRYTRYADDLTFSLPQRHKGNPRLGTIIGQVSRIVADEGFEIHPRKTRVARQGARQQVTGLVVNNTGKPRVPRRLKRQLRAAIHNLGQGKPLKDGETPETLAGYAAFVHMTDPKLGKKFLEALKRRQ
jgi:retron-type reverse transcriptase